ncbi:altronate hydrolase [Catalinimonas alkaloidigena]|uniref:Altronate hydrolase n=1 Tax=Catalinimonas alkaloidigena TaxID=1075417 RepID=A0A1G8WXS1_9BACT|nr:altronate dehydratase family protein [Catalinimonas alkaloidigena]SDJ83182.1 altronate hydrolase [Catalinimonas alkaloidigena]
MKKVLKVQPTDNVIVALTDLAKGEAVEFEGRAYRMLHDTPAKHKFAEQDFAVGDPLYMYGVLIGRAAAPIQAGEVITTKNVKHAATGFAGRQGKTDWQAPDVSKWKDRTFMGYHRSDGRVGTANHWLVVPMVFCENRNINVIREALVEQLGYEYGGGPLYQSQRLVDVYRSGGSAEQLMETEILIQAEEQKARRVFPNVDGIKFLTHEGGCGGTRQDSDTLCRLLAGYICHPNVAGATVLSLGCQNAQVEILQEAIQRINPNFDKPLYILEQQQSQSEPQMISDAIRKTFVGLIQANEQIRRPAPLSKLTFGVECGGSDGFSGISANPAIGYASDMLVALGGTVILSEFPELCGVEQELIDRCVNDDLAEKFRSIQTAYARRAEESGSGFDMNPSPGNIKDGLITDAMKSAGAAKKGGTSPITDVLDYTEAVVNPGLNLLCTPGNDVESTTGLAGSGANIIMFSTGLGTPTGNPVTPVIKVSSNSKLAERMADIIDYNAGTVITGEKTIPEAGEELFDYCVKVASGEAQPHAVRLGQDDFIPWKRGVSL